MNLIIKAVFLGLIILASLDSQAKPYKVAIIDDGLDPIVQEVIKDHICKTGGYDYVKKERKISASTRGHGNEVIGSLLYAANTKSFCVMVYRINSVMDIAKGIKLAVDDGAKLINLSVYSLTYFLELENAVIYAEKSDVRLFTAAGNSGENLNEICNIYPQCLKNNTLTVVGATGERNEVARYSNYGSQVVKMYKYGVSITGATGTSFASPFAMGEHIWSLNLDKEDRQ